VIEPVCEILPVGESPGAPTSTTTYLLDQLVVTTARLAEQRCLRARRHLAHGETDYVTLHLYLRGSMRGSLGGVPLHMAPDRVSLQDYAHPFTSTAKASLVLGVTIPRRLIRSSGQIYRRAPMFSWSLDSPPGRLLAGAMRSLWRALPGIRPQDAHAAANEFVALVNGILDRGFGNQPQPDSLLDNSLGIVLRAYLTANLLRPDLTVEHLCERFHCSRATLYRLFKNDGGVRRFVTDQRLARSFHALALPGPNGRRVKDVAERWGFFNASHFNRLFRQRFDMVPSEVMANPDGSVSPDLSDCPTHCQQDMLRLNAWFEGRLTDR